MDALPGALREDVPKPTTADFLTASLPAQPSEANLTAQPSRATAPLPPGQGSTALSQVDIQNQDGKQTTLDNDGPARGTTLGSDTYGASTRSGDGDGLATALGAAVDDTETAHPSDGGATVAGHPGGDRAGLGGGNFEAVDDALSAQLRDLGRAASLAATLSAEHSVEQVLSTQYRAQVIATTAVYEKSKFKRSRIKKGRLIKRLTGYSIAETEYGVSYLWVLSRKPDRTSADNSVYGLAGYFKWKSLEDSGLLKREKKSK